ncbi:hypothetical protein CEXT_750781, partial [Caerostris extrusa]
RFIIKDTANPHHQRSNNCSDRKSSMVGERTEANGG